MSISSINYGSSVLGQSIQNINQQLTNLSTQLSTGVKATNYAGMGTNEGFAIAARSQLSNITAYGDTMTNVTTIINAANAALQSLSDTVSEVQSEASASPQNLTSTGQTIGQQNAASQLSAMVGMLNTQVGDRYIFSGNAISTPAVASADDILNGSGTQAGLKQVIAERLQADLGSGSPPTGRLVLSQPTTTSVQVAEDVAGSPFGLKLASVSSSNASGASPPDIAVAGPSGSPAAITVDLSGGNPSPGDQVTFKFSLPDGTSQSVTLTATNTTPPPSGSFAIDPASSANTASNLNTALNTAITTIANTSLVAASAVAAGNNFFNTTTVVGNAVNNQAGTPAPITGATALSGTAGTDSLASGFSAGDTITVNGQTITFVASGASGNNQINVTDNVQTLLTKIDALTGTSTPSTVNGGVVTLNGNSASPSLTVTSSNTAAFAALGFSGGTATAGPLRVSGSPPTSLTSGAANTVSWYTGNSGPGTARSTATVRVDNSQTVQFGAQANELAIRNALQQIAVYAAVVVNPPGSSNAGAQASALSQRVAANLTPQPGQQAISDIQTEFATAQNTMKDVQARQTQSQAALQNLISGTEGISQDQVASEILALQTSLQASYQTTAMLSQLSLVKFLPVA
ncbi:flagellar protein [Bradyrhizobium sp. Tv2a-2]|uniref:flagellar protein n=1 Tax=Bradyrhizobium sp. Tv2a-2 TaxID=113395 RepID=UPI00041E2222|nr:flagellar protein [Bradyrhizobium sp. Tv2a-2]